MRLVGFTLLNAHVYLDTVLLMGSIGARHTLAVQLLRQSLARLAG
jgi:arginine exporter protein ArgO